MASYQSAILGHQLAAGALLINSGEVDARQLKFLVTAGTPAYDLAAGTTNTVKVKEPSSLIVTEESPA